MGGFIETVILSSIAQGQKTLNPHLARKLYLGLQTLRGEAVWRALIDVRGTEFVSQGELQAIQAARQLNQLRYVIQNVPYYKTAYTAFSKSILHTASYVDVLRIMEDLPVLEKDLLRRSPELFISDNTSKLRTYPDKTSGTSGTPLTFPCDQQSWAYRHALIYRCMESFGVQIGEKYAYFYGLHWSKRSQMHLKLRDWILNRIRISAYRIEAKYLEEQFRAISAYKPTHFLGYPSAIYDFCFLLKERGWDLRALKLKAVFVTAEPLHSYQRSLIQEVTGSRCVDFYGSAEGGTNAFECPEGRMHIAAESTWISTDSRNPSSEDLLVTDMMLRAFPMLKYAIGDEGILTNDVCPCGRPHPLIESVRGRSGESILLPNGRRINSHIPGYIFKPLGALGVIQKFRFVQKGNLLTLYLVVTKNFNGNHIQIIRKEILTAFGADVPCEICVVEDLPYLPNAKFSAYIRVKD